MTNKYLLAVCFPEEYPKIITVNAKSMEEAKNRFMYSISDILELDVPSDWEDFLNISETNNVLIGEIYNLEEF